MAALQRGTVAGEVRPGQVLLTRVNQVRKRIRRSLNAEMIRALETAAAEGERRRQLKSLRKELDRFAASLPPLDDSAPLIRRDRER